ncbi:MAG TPA: hypothetical protein VE979_18400, partial [Streptosporangiaceae bacterium]|nr:hypothetical protein [Streptosporangiaceae bacterium]
PWPPRYRTTCSGAARTDTLADHHLTQIGGYRAMPATGDRHAARLVFQSASVLIADLVRIAGQLIR